MGEAIHETDRRPLRLGQTLFEAADELALGVPASCRRTGRCRECVVQVLEGGQALGERTEAEAFLPEGFRLACQAVVARDDFDVRFAILRRRLRILMPSDAPLDTAVRLDPMAVRESAGIVYGGELLGPAVGRVLGLAVDVGTTTVVFELVDLESGQSLAAAAFENPQRFGGSDVMSRISYDSGRPGELGRALRRALNHELDAIYRRLAVDRHEVCEAVVVGNPTMRDLFFGLDVAPLGRSPFRSVSESVASDGRRQSSSLLRRAHDLGVLIHPQGRIYGPPIIASHVGADTAADLVATDFAALPGVSLLIDIGTNTEIVIGDGTRLIAASSPAGPALEGGGVGCGMPGADGAIESVRWVDGAFQWRTIGDGPPEGICGSGLVDLLAEASRHGFIRPDTTFGGGRRSIPVAPEAGIELTRSDVSNLAQAKSANEAGQRILMRRLGVTPDQVDRVFLAGAFAGALDVRNAVAIGLLAPVPLDRFHRIGNASVRGAKLLLLSASRRRELETVIGGAEHAELESEPDFFELFVEGCRLDLAQVAS